MGGSHGTALQLDGPRSLEVHEHIEEPGCAVLTLVGELDGGGGVLLEGVLVRTWAAWPVAVTIDLRLVSFLNGRGLTSLLGAAGVARTRQVPLTLQCRPGLVARLLVLAGMGEQLAQESAPRARTGPSALGLTPASPPATLEGALG